MRALAPIFARLKNEKCLERAENLTETLATQAIPHFDFVLDLSTCVHRADSCIDLS